MSAPGVEILREARMHFDDALHHFVGVRALALIGNHRFYSELPEGAGHAESINRDLQELVAERRKS